MPWARLKEVVVEQDLANRGSASFRLVLDFAGEEISSEDIPAKDGPKLALALLALAAIDDRAAVELPALGTFRLGNLQDAATMLLAYYPGPIAEDGIAGLLGVVTS